MAKAELDEAEWELWRSYARSHRLLSRELDRGLQRGAGISQSEFAVLLSLFEAPKRRLLGRELVDALGWEKSRVSHQITRMEARGLTARSECDGDGRSSWVEITPEGRRTVLRAIRSHSHDIRRLFFDPLGSAGSTAIGTAAHRIIETIDPPAAESEDSESLPG